MTAYYNEFDPKAAAWLRELIKQGHIAPGEVDERSIKDVRADELSGFTQCHFFAGIGVWSYALRQAGWADDRPVWTGSCPCQPFSAAGKSAGFDDSRHLWPDWFELIKARRPEHVIGEQVSSADAMPWIDLVRDNLDNEDYTVGCLDTSAAGVGAPHIRQRLYWVAHAGGQGLEKRISQPGIQRQAMGGHQREAIVGSCDAGGLADTESGGCGVRRHEAQPRQGGHVDCGSRDMRPGPTNGFWRNADWLGFRDDKWRPVEPGTFPLANGATSRVGRLRGYGNAINAEQAKAFIEIYLDVTSNAEQAKAFIESFLDATA